jgi:hypothetical protein
MGHFAKVLDGKVLTVIVAESEFFDTFVDTSPGEWIQTSYNTRGGIHYEPNGVTPSNTQWKALRKNYASGVGYTYDKSRDAFIPPQPFPSWTLNADTCLWESPVPMPVTEHQFIWNEANKNWTILTGPWEEIT